MYDVVVVGARCAAASTALLLARAGCRVSFEWVATADEILEKVALVDRDFRKLLACNLK